MGRAMPGPIMGTVTVGINVTVPSPLSGTTAKAPSPISPPWGHHGVAGRGCLFLFGVNLTQIGDTGLRLGAGGWISAILGSSQVVSNHPWVLQD